MKSMTLIIAAITAASALANTAFADAAAANNYIQEIHVANLLANHELTDPGMTPTAVVVEYYNGSSRPCWSNHLDYRDDVTIHAGPTQGCKNKVTRVVISPMLTADKLKTYLAPVYAEIDPSKYATQIIVMQNTPPAFDSKNGLVSMSGTAKVQMQSQLKD